MSKKIAVLGTGANGAAIGADLPAPASTSFLSTNGRKTSRLCASAARASKCLSEVLTVPVRAFNLCDVCTFTDLSTSC